MTDGNEKDASTDVEAAAQDRRNFLKKAARAAAVAPAVTLLLSASSNSAKAGDCYWPCTTP